jgi:uncharacterized repeat protein (TIGR03806 family)
MKYIVKSILLIILPVVFIAYMVSCNLKNATKVVLDISAKPYEKLSEYHFFSGDMKELMPNARVIPYDLITPLFSDYAHKARFMYVPEGKSTDYDTTQVLQLPVGACLIKNFYYPDDFRNKNGKRKIIETRLLVHREAAWEALDYVWNDEQTDAVLENAGDVKKVSWIHYDGVKREIDYVIPNKNQCKGCHWNNGIAITPIGPKVRNLNHDYAYAEGTENQLTHLSKAGFIKNVPSPDKAPRIADWTDSVHFSVNDRARAYLEVNCGHCHNPKGPAYTSGLHLNIDNYNLENLGFCKAPVAAGKGTGNRLFDIIPGSPDKSILVYRMASAEPGIRMPELGRSLVHQEGLELITRWIAEMQPNDCKIKQP